jgi:hypothetical protein
VRYGEAEEHFGRRCSDESLVGPKVSVIEESQLNSAFELGSSERRKKPKSEEGLCRSPKSFDESDGADLPDSAEAVGDGVFVCAAYHLMHS